MDRDEYVVRVNGKDWAGRERNFELESFRADDELVAREIGWARVVNQVSPLPNKAILFRKTEEGLLIEIGRVF
jgi:hypothetical protein